MPEDKPVIFDPHILIFKNNNTVKRIEYPEGSSIFSQGEIADAVYYIETGKISLRVVSGSGKEAIVGLLGEGGFFGESCLVGQNSRMVTAVAMTKSTVIRLDKVEILRAIHEEPKFVEKFILHLLERAIRIESDLVDKLFNSSEKRLARLLLLLANFEKESGPDLVIPKISQETLAQMVGTTRPRISVFMNKFRKLSFIEYNGGIKIHNSLLNVVLYDDDNIGT